MGGKNLNYYINSSKTNSEKESKNKSKNKVESKGSSSNKLSDQNLQKFSNKDRNNQKRRNKKKYKGKNKNKANGDKKKSSNKKMVRHCHEDALTDQEFEELLKGARKMKSPRNLQARFIILLAGRLGLRSGEITHIQKSWVNWNRSMIQIPSHEPCDCGYCRQQARQMADYNEMKEEEAMNLMWKAKTEDAARSIPYDFSERLRSILEKFFNTYTEYPKSKTSVNRRVRKARDKSIINKRIYPHALRATAATFHAYRGLKAFPLQSLMGWSQVDTSRKYIRLSGGATAEALRQVH